MIFFYFFLFISSIFLQSTSFAQAEITIKGWPFYSRLDLNQEKPSSNIGGDPILGRLICPALTRLNLKEKKSENLLIKTSSVEKKDNKTIFHFTLKSGLFWWRGHDLKSRDLEVFLRSALDELSTKIGDVSVLKSVQINFPSETSFNLTFEKSTALGLFLFNDFPVWREAENKRYECLGRLIPEKDHQFTSQLKYGMKRQVINFEDSIKSAKENSSRLVYNFLSAAQMRREGLCSAQIPIPLVSGVEWQRAELLNETQIQIRRILTQALPRGELLRSSAYGLGELTAGPFLSVYPLLGRSLKIMPFNLTLNENQKKAISSLKEILISTKLSSNDTEKQLSKVIYQNWQKLGVNVKDYTENSPISLETLLGNLRSIELPWPSHDLSLYLNVLKEKVSPDKASKELLDKLIESNRLYLLSLSTLSPRFELLLEILTKLQQTEVFSAFFQHELCLVSKYTKDKTPLIHPKTLDTLDPDWFKDLSQL